MNNKIKLTFEQLKSLLNENNLSETSRRQKAVKAFNGLSPHIKTFAILTAENPMGKSVSPDENKKLNNNLVSDLKGDHFRYFPVHGSFKGNPENPFMVFNIGLDDAKYLCHKYDQAAFVMANVLDKGHVIFKYYERRFNNKYMEQKGWLPNNIPPIADYQEKSRQKTVDILDAATADGYTGIFRKLKFKIPFDCFESFHMMLESRCNRFECYRECLDERIERGINGNGARNRMQVRASIYGDRYEMFWNDIG